MKRELLSFTCGVVITCVMGIGISSASGVWDTIDVLRNDITVVVNGETVTADNFLYNDTTYLPLRAIGEALDKNVYYDETTNTAVISDKGDGNIAANTATNKYTPPNFMIEDDAYIEIENGIYVAHAACIGYYVEPLGFEISFDNDTQEFIFLKNGTEAYRYPVEDFGIRYDNLIDIVVPALEALQ